MKKIALLLVPCLIALQAAFAQTENVETKHKRQLLKVQRNKPERVEWFRNLGFGMFIHWSMDSQLGSVISHSMAGASPDYLEWFVNELPLTFNPTRFNPEQWAVQAKLAGMKYVVFTAKHHSGFCMFDTKTTDFSLAKTPFKRDITREVIEAFRKHGLAVGLYFSPDDFHYLYRNNLPMDRDSPQSLPGGNPQLMDFTKRQLKELLTNYGKIDMIFLDGQTAKHEWINTELAAYCWDLNPDILVTRGGMETPEQNLPAKPFDGPWEACFTMGTQWHYKPTHEKYKSGTELIELLIETRSKGGNLLLNVGPQPDGELPFEQVRLLQEIGLWHAVNREALRNIEPFSVQQEGDVWYVKAKDKETVFAFMTRHPLAFGERREVLLEALQGSEQTKVSVLGHDGKTLEYHPGADVSHWARNTDKGLLVSYVQGQRLYNDFKWPNPVVLKIENVGLRK